MSGPAAVLTPSQSGLVRRIGRRLRLRPTVDACADTVRLWIDTASDPIYQPLTYVGKKQRGKRAEGTEVRWEMMLPIIEETNPRTALDLGCNIGWMAMSLASLGVETVGVESHGANYRTALYAAKRSQVSRFSLLVMDIKPSTVKLLPSADCVLFLSLWHHVVRAEGFEAATDILSEIWARTSQTLFFETGESEMPASYRLPVMDPNPREWLTDYLVSSCPGGEVEHLGLAPSGSEDGVALERNLFAVRRASA